MLKNVLLVIGSTLAVCLILELLLSARPDLQAANPGPRHVFCRGPAQRYQQHPVFLKTEIPDSIYFEDTGEGWSIHINNHHGFRDVFDTGTEHAIILGDSFMRGTSVSDHETVPYLLDLWYPNLAFHSFAIGGSGTADAYQTYKIVGKQWDHRLVVLGYFLGNDLHNNLARGAEFKGGNLYGAESTEAQTMIIAEKLVEKLHRSLQAHSHLYNLVYTSIKIATVGRKGEELSPQKLTLAAQMTKEIFKALGQDVASNNAELLIVVIPSWNEVMNLGELTLAKVQREIIEQVDRELNNVHVYDLKAGRLAREW